jgi:hypothetical protein
MIALDPPQSGQEGEPMTEDVMKRAYRVARELLWDRLNDTSPGTTEILKQVHQADLIVVPGQYDHIESVLDITGMPYSVLTPGRLEGAKLRPDQIVFVNCPGQVSPKAVRKLTKFVHDGGFLFTTDWALKHILEPGFPGYVQYNQRPTGDEVVRIEILDREDGFLMSILDSEDDPLWWLEGSSYPIQILKPDKVRVLIRSKEIRERHGEEPVFISFEYGEGVVYHMISHFYLQRSETRTARHAKPSTEYVMSKGVEQAAMWKYQELGAEEITTSQLQSALASQSTIVGIVLLKKARDRQRKGE